MFSRVGSAGPTDFSGGSAPTVGIQYVYDDYFATFGIDVIRGRVFDRSVNATAQPAVVLSERAAAQLFPDSDPIGQTVTMTREVFAQGRSGAVIGVVNDVLYDRPEQGVTPDAYVSIRQGGMGTTVALRTVGEPLEVLDEARAVLNSLDREVPIAEVRTLEELKSASVADTRLLAMLLTIFGGVTLILAAAGVWGVVANMVTQQRREFGLRMALGAGSTSVIGLVLKQGIVLAAAGVFAGLLTVWALSRVLGSLLYEVSPLDPLSLVGAAVVLTCITVVAAYIPAHRATTIDPMEVLKTD
jgi:ABC-type antimicrobial peptide transport system permease subunit